MLNCMVTLLQGYVGASDAEAVELAIVDLRRQMVLGCLGAVTPSFSQGALQVFRERMIEHHMDRRLLERTVELVRSKHATEGEAQAVSKALRVALDSRPLAGAGRVEDTINLLGHAARCIVQVVSKIIDRPVEEICRKARIPLLLAPSIKAGLDIDWSDPKQKATAIEVVERQVSSLQQWVDRHLDDYVSEPLRPYLEAITQARDQDLETAENGTVRIRQGVAQDRRISIEDKEMRHGLNDEPRGGPGGHPERKTRSRRLGSGGPHRRPSRDRAPRRGCRRGDPRSRRAAGRPGGGGAGRRAGSAVRIRSSCSIGGAARGGATRAWPVAGRARLGRLCSG